MHRFGDALKLLVATDLTPRSDRAVERAAQLARDWKAPLTMLHVVSDELPRSMQRSRIEEAEQALKAQVQPLLADGVAVEHLIAKGHDYEAIIAQAQKEKSSVILMGTHRKTLMREYWLGTTVDKVVRHGDRPILIVRQRPLRAYDRILVAVDFSAPSLQALEFALLLFPRAEFNVLHVFHVPFKAFQPGQKTARHFEELAETEMKGFIDGIAGDFRARFGEPTSKIETIVKEGFPTNIVHRHVKKMKPDLVVVGTHGRTGFRQALLGSVAEDLISSLQHDVLAVRPLHAAS